VPELRISATRYHDISTGHRVHGHESKCAHLHGHNYRFHLTVAPTPDDICLRPDGLDCIGRVLDFGVIKQRLCMWLEDTWDHKFLLWEQDPFANTLRKLDPLGVVLVPFNPTAENMGAYLLRFVGPEELAGTGCVLTQVIVEETAKCSATARFHI
jgi:6-pyruvoyltetrahydropterin/6-carboxytetrahydropterin synthase